MFCLINESFATRREGLREVGYHQVCRGDCWISLLEIMISFVFIAIRHEPFFAR